MDSDSVSLSWEIQHIFFHSYFLAFHRVMSVLWNACCPLNFVVCIVFIRVIFHTPFFISWPCSFSLLLGFALFNLSGPALQISLPMWSHILVFTSALLWCRGCYTTELVTRRSLALAHILLLTTRLSSQAVCWCCLHCLWDAPVKLGHYVLSQVLLKQHREAT